MRVLEMGKAPDDPNTEYQCRCTHCKTLFAFRRDEARKSFDQRDGDALVINCPTCKREAWIDVRALKPVEGG